MVKEVKLVCASDTHNLHNSMTEEIPDGDILLCAGDFTDVGRIADVQSFCEFSRKLPHEKKIITPGNHDYCCEARSQYSLLVRENLEDAGWTYLLDEECEAEGLRIWGSPWQPWFYDWAFNLQRGPEIAAKWDLIPSGIDVLMTHGPPMGILDRVKAGEHVGCQDLMDKINEIKPKVHVFGHIHEAYGQEERDGVVHINASICTLRYRPTNKPIIYNIKVEDD